MQEVVLLGFAHVSIITAVVTGCFVGGHSVIQVSFHAHFMLNGYCGIDEQKIILIDKGRNKQETRKKELFWQYKLDTFVPHGLNKRAVDLEWI